MWLLLLRKALTVHRLTIRRLPHDEVCPLCLSGMKLMNILHWNFFSLKGCGEFSHLGSSSTKGRRTSSVPLRIGGSQPICPPVPLSSETKD